MKRIKRIRILGSIALMLISTLLVAASVSGASKELPAPATAEQDAAGREVLSQMADLLSQASGFGVTIRSSYDAIQQDGQQIEFSERRKVLLQRPGLLRVESARSDGDLTLLLFDGKTITAFKSGENVYAQAEKPGTVDAAVVYLVKTLQTPFPLARMLLTTLSKDVQQWIESVRFVEKDMLTEPPSVHLAGRSVDVDFQIWIAEGDRPLPQRIVLTYRNEPGQPQFRADFIDWSLTPETDAASFTFVPPENAEQIVFLAPVQKSSLPDAREGGKP